MTGGTDDKEERTKRCHLAANMLQRIKKNWFLLGVVCVITCARLWPWLGAKGGEQSGAVVLDLCISLQGPLKPEVTVKYISVMAIFLTSGMSMRTEVANSSQYMLLVACRILLKLWSISGCTCLSSHTL